jgi:hypothetical protein
MIQKIKDLLQEVYFFIKKDYDTISYLYTLLFCGVCIYLNYTYDWYDTYLASTYATGWSMLYFSLFYVVAYFMVSIPILLIRKQKAILTNPLYYIKTLFFIVSFAAIVGNFTYQDIKIEGFNYLEHHYLIRIISFFKANITTLPLLIIAKYMWDRKEKGLYGLTISNKHITAYMSLFLLLLPFLVWISFTPDFLSAYPMYRYWRYEGIFGWENWQHTLVFESVYASFYVITELVLRGALIIGMASIMGRHAILPMVAMYCVLHFGKPIGETISSIFGGYILGALAYQTRHIWGGVIIHIAIALSMEIMGLIHYYLGIHKS